jgi:urea transport system permease protein
MRLLSKLLSTLLPIFAVCLLSFGSFANTPTESPDQLTELMTQLPTTKLKQMPALITAIAETKAPEVRSIFTTLMNGDLYYEKSGKTIVKAQKNLSKNYDVSNILTGESLGEMKKNKIKKIRTNNALRGKMRGLLAQIDLTDANEDIRLQAVKQLLDKPNTASITALATLVNTEKDEDVKELMHVALSVNSLKTGTITEQLGAIENLKGSLEPSVRNMMIKKLDDLTQQLAQQGAVKTPDQAALAKALTLAVDKIDERRNIFEIIENLFFGLSLGSVFLLAAIGLTITFGVMGVINMAHGEMMMLGAYTTYVIQQAFPGLIEYSLLMAIPAAFLVSGLVGVLIERGVIRHLKGRPLETLLATFGISLILQQLVRTIFSPLNRQVSSPEWMSGSLEINPVFALTYNRLYIIIFSLMVFFALMLILKKTSLGLHVRAVSQDRDMARALSIKSNWVDAITFGLGSGIAGVAGVVLSQLTNVGPNLGQAYIIDSFLVVVFGGVGNLWGTLVAAMSLGTINKFLEPLTGSVLANIIVLVGLVLFIQKRPKGLFPQKGRSAD